MAYFVLFEMTCSKNCCNVFIPSHLRPFDLRLDLALALMSVTVPLNMKLLTILCDDECCVWQLLCLVAYW